MRLILNRDAHQTAPPRWLEQLFLNDWYPACQLYLPGFHHETMFRWLVRSRNQKEMLRDDVEVFLLQDCHWVEAMTTAWTSCCWGWKILIRRICTNNGTEVSHKEGCVDGIAAWRVNLPCLWDEKSWTSFRIAVRRKVSLRLGVPLWPRWAGSLNEAHQFWSPLRGKNES